MEKPKLRLEEQVVTLQITGMPDFMWQIRKEVAKGLRRVATGEELRVSRRLHEIAAALEAGQAAGDEPCRS